MYRSSTILTLAWRFPIRYRRAGNGAALASSDARAAFSLALLRRSDRVYLRSFVLALAITVGAALSPKDVEAQALSSNFTYQGELKALGVAANGNFDIELRLFDAASGGTQLGATQQAGGVPVTNGLFTLTPDFGPAQFAGERQWLEIRIRSAVTGNFETLTPRTEVTAAPYAWAAANALSNSVTGTSVVNGSISSLDIADGGISALDLSENSVSGPKIADGSIFGNDLAPDSIGSTRIADGNVFLQDLSASSVNSSKIVDGSIALADVDSTQLQARVSGSCAAGSSISAIAANGTVSCEADDIGSPGWSLVGNAGTNPSTQFIGTTDNQALVLRVNNAQALRIEPNANSPNLIGGFSGNVVTAGKFGETISGGGVAGSTNAVVDFYGTVGGGAANLAGNFATAGGGSQNAASGDRSTVAGGRRNTASGQISSIGGGQDNIASGGFSAVTGGNLNTASGFASTVSGGRESIASGEFSVASGSQNCAGGDNSFAIGSRAQVRPGNEVGDGICGANSGDANGDEGTFVWADSSAPVFGSTGPNQFLIRATGGAGINTNTPTPGAALTVNGNVSVSQAGALSFGSQVRQMLNLWGPDQYGIGVQASRLYYRTAIGGGFSWFEGGVHNDVADNAGAGGILRMRLSSTGQLQTTTGTISTLSDARLKRDVHDYVGALDQISALRPVHYTYIDGGKAAFQPAGEQLGFIAQEMQQVFPQWVSEDDSGRLMLSMRGFEAVAVRGLQELSAENAALREQLADLVARLEAIERTAR